MCVNKEWSGQNIPRSISSEIGCETSLQYLSVCENSGRFSCLLPLLRSKMIYTDRSAETKLSHFLYRPAVFCVPLTELEEKEGNKLFVFIVILRLIFQL